MLAVAPRWFAVIAQGIRVERPPPGTLRRGVLGLESPSAGAVLLALSIAAVALVLGLAIARRVRR